MSKYKENLAKQSTPIDIKGLIANRFSDPKQAVSEYLNSFQDRTGLKHYLNQVNAQLEESENTKTAAIEEAVELNNEAPKDIQSILELEDIKNSIDGALGRKEFSRTVDLLNKLQDVVNNDPRVPDDMKGVTMDSELVDYIKSKINPDDEDIDYNHILKNREVPITNSDPSKAYFNFDSTEEYV